MCSPSIHVHVQCTCIDACLSVHVYYMYMYLSLTLSFLLSLSLSLTAPGVELLKVFQKEYSEKEKQRQELTNAEKLFDLSITMFPGMVDVDRELRNIAKVYNIYEAQRVSVV